MAEILKLPSERMEQLRGLAVNLNMTMADAVGVLIREQIERGNLKDEIPGVTISRDGERVHLDTGAFKTTLPRTMARDVAAQLKVIAEPVKKSYERTPAALRPVNWLNIARRGTSVKLLDPATGAERTFAPSVAKDVARLLEKAAR